MTRNNADFTPSLASVRWFRCRCEWASPPAQGGEWRCELHGVERRPVLLGMLSRQLACHAHGQGGGLSENKRGAAAWRGGRLIAVSHDERGHADC